MIYKSCGSSRFVDRIDPMIRIHWWFLHKELVANMIMIAISLNQSDNDDESCVFFIQPQLGE